LTNHEKNEKKENEREKDLNWIQTEKQRQTERRREEETEKQRDGEKKT
jgi:hypothetical protein